MLNMDIINKMRGYLPGFGSEIVKVVDGVEYSIYCWCSEPRLVMLTAISTETGEILYSEDIE